MTLRPALALSLALSVAGGLHAQAAAPAVTAPAADSPADDLKALVTRVRAKLGAEKPTASGLAPELAAFDSLLAKYRDQKTDDVAQILFMQAMLYGEVLKDLDKMKALFTQLQAGFPGTQTVASVDRTLSSLERRAKAEQASASLVGQPAPALNFKWSTRDGLKTLADLKGKVVVLDFWATWCGPCVASFPQVRELAAHYKDMDVVVVGVTSIQGSITGLQPQKIDTSGDPQKEMALMTDYIKAKDITWTVVFSEQEVFNPDYGVTGIPHMAIIAPDGSLRHTGLHPAMPHTEKVGMIDALLKEFKLPVIASSPNR